MLLPIVVAVVRALATGWFPIGDNALLAVRAYDVGTPHHPLLGSWTSASLALGVNVNNPGPLYSDLAAPFMWTVGRLAGIGPATALAVGSINAAFALGTLLVANRVGGWRTERWMLLLVAALTWSMGSELLIDIWQPHALLLAFVCLLLLTTGIAAGDLRLLPWWLGVTSLVVQTHVAYVYVAAVLVAGGARGRARCVSPSRRRRAARPSAGRSSLAASSRTAAVVVVGARRSRGSSRSSSSCSARGRATSSGSPRTPAAVSSPWAPAPAVKIVAAVTALPPWWARSGWEDSVPSTPLTQGPDGPQLVVTGLPGAAIAALSLLVLVGVLVGLVVLLRRPEQRLGPHGVGGVDRRARDGGRWSDDPDRHAHRARQPPGAMDLRAVGVRPREHRLGRRRAGPRPPADAAVARSRVLLAVVAVLVVINLPFAAHDLGPTADRAAASTLERTFDDLTDFDPGGAVVYETDNVRVFEPNSAAVMMRLREVGVEFRFEGEVDVRQFGEGRRADGTEVARLRQFERADALLYRGDGCTLSLRSGVSRGRRSRGRRR